MHRHMNKYKHVSIHTCNTCTMYTIEDTEARLWIYVYVYLNKNLRNMYTINIDGGCREEKCPCQGVHIPTSSYCCYG